MPRKFARAIARSLPGLKAENSGAGVHNGPSVAIIIPTFNSAAYISGAVTSALSSRGVSVSVLVVDDASSDMTTEVVRNLSEQDHRIRLVTNQTNRGSYVCKNIGIEQSESDYLAFLDSDDVQHPDRLWYQISQLERNDLTKATYCRLRRWDTSFRYPMRGLRMGFVTSIFHRTLIDEIGFFDSVRFGADAEFHDRLLAKFGPKATQVLPNELYFARFREGSVTSSGDGQIFFRTGRGSIRFRASETRRRYRENFRNWHLNSSNLYMGFPLESRPFQVSGRKQEG